MDAAATQGNLHELKFYHENRSEGCTTRAMDVAAGGGLLGIVRFLHENRSEGCTTRAMDTVAENNCLHVVKFLHENRSEGSTARAISKAVKSGYLAMVEFLYWKREERCSANALKQALKHNHLRVVDFLFDHNQELLGPELLHDLLLFGALDIWTELRAVYPDEAYVVVESVMFKAGVHQQLPTFHFVIHELGRDDLAHLAVDGAAKSPHGDTNVQWLRAVMAITGPDSCRLTAVNNGVYTASQGEPTRLQYLITVYAESGALEAAIVRAKEMPKKARWLPGKMEAWALAGRQLELPPVHPLLLDHRCPAWAVSREQCVEKLQSDWFRRIRGPVPWAVEAIYLNDRVVLEMLLDLDRNEPLLTFNGARAAAIRVGFLLLLQWLLSNVDLPIEPTLLDEALYYHQFETAEWLADNCLEGCREFNWDNKVNTSWISSCDIYDGELLPWIEDHPRVRSLVDFGVITDRAVKSGTVTLLRQLYRTHPDVFKTREDLLITAIEYEDNDEVVEFLKEIEHPFLDVDTA